MANPDGDLDFGQGQDPAAAAPPAADAAPPQSPVDENGDLSFDHIPGGAPGPAETAPGGGGAGFLTGLMGGASDAFRETSARATQMTPHGGMEAKPWEQIGQETHTHTPGPGASDAEALGYKAGEMGPEMAAGALPAGQAVHGIASLLANSTTRNGAAQVVQHLYNSPLANQLGKSFLRHVAAKGLEYVTGMPGWASHLIDQNLEGYNLVRMFHAADQAKGAAQAAAPAAEAAAPAAARAATQAPKYKMPSLSDKYGQWQTPGGQDLPVGTGSPSVNARGGAIDRDGALQRTMQRVSSAKRACR